MSSIDIRAIVLATLAVFGIDFVTGMVLVAVFGGPLANGSEEQVKSDVRAQLLEEAGHPAGVTNDFVRPVERRRAERDGKAAGEQPALLKRFDWCHLAAY